MKIKYQKPKCECGGELVYIEERTHEVLTKINNDGNFSKVRKISRTDVGLCGAFWLQCLECDKEYEVSDDQKHRIIRGDKR